MTISDYNEIYFFITFQSGFLINTLSHLVNFFIHINYIYIHININIQLIIYIHIHVRELPLPLKLVRVLSLEKRVHMSVMTFSIINIMHIPLRT